MTDLVAAHLHLIQRLSVQLLVNPDEGGGLCSNDGSIPPGQLGVSQRQLTKAATGWKVPVQGAKLLLQQDHLVISQLG